MNSNDNDLLPSCSTDSEQDSVIMAVMMMYLGFINGDIKRARYGAAFLIAAQRTGITSEDVSNTVIACLDIYNKEQGWFRKWERRAEFVQFMMSQLNRVNAIIHSTKIFTTTETEKRSALVREMLDNILDKKEETKEEE